MLNRVYIRPNKNLNHKDKIYVCTLDYINQIGYIYIYMKYSRKIGNLSWTYNKLVEGISQPHTK